MFIKSSMILTTFLLTSCAMVNTKSEINPVGKIYTKRNNVPVEQIKVFGPNDKVDTPLVCFAFMRAAGNGYADTNDLIESLKKEASKLGAEAITYGEGKSVSTSSVSTYIGYGVSVNDQIKTPLLGGAACNFSEVSLGIVLDPPTGKITYVRSGSVAEKNGIKEAMTILAVNGRIYSTDKFTVPIEVNTKKKGDKVEIELLDFSGQKLKKTITLE